MLLQCIDERRLKHGMYTRSARCILVSNVELDSGTTRLPAVVAPSEQTAAIVFVSTSVRRAIAASSPIFQTRLLGRDNLQVLYVNVPYL